MQRLSARPHVRRRQLYELRRARVLRVIDSIINISFYSVVIGLGWLLVVMALSI